MSYLGDDFEKAFQFLVGLGFIGLLAVAYLVIKTIIWVITHVQIIW